MNQSWNVYTGKNALVLQFSQEKILFKVCVSEQLSESKNDCYVDNVFIWKNIGFYQVMTNGYM